jgi:hypothetical protein
MCTDDGTNVFACLLYVMEAEQMSFLAYRIDANQERLIAKMDAWLEKMVSVTQ